MSYHHIGLVSLTLSINEAEIAVPKLIAYLQDRKIIEPILSDCINRDGQGYAPGPNYLDAIEHPEYGAHILQNKVNGLDITTGKCMSTNATGDYSKVACPKCKAERPQDDAWSDAASLWIEGQDVSDLLCESCQMGSPIFLWDHFGDIAFGNLMLEFCSWPMVKKEFVKSLSEVAGSDFVVIQGHL